MRDVIVLALFAAGALAALRRPFVGVLLYFWISFMNPHRFTWGFAYNLPLAMVAALVTLVSLALNPKDARFPRTRETYLFLLLWAFMTLTTATAFHPALARETWTVISKIFFMTLVAVCLVTTRKRLIVLLIAIIVYVGSIGIKGAIFGFLTGGEFRVWGPPDSFLEDNNALGLAMVMIAPLCFFLRDIAAKRWQSWALLGTAVASFISAALTYSRGALVGLVAIGFFMFMASKHKIRTLVVGCVLVAVGLSFLPASWYGRMSTIETYEEDNSAQMRLNSWRMSFNLAASNLLGGGFDCFSMDEYYRYAPNPSLGRTHSGVGSTAHSLYFEVIATQGFIGFGIYMACVVSMLGSLYRLDKLGRTRTDGAWITSLSRALFVSYIGFLTAGAFQSKAFYDMFWALYGAGISLKAIVLAPIPAKAAPLERVAPARAQALVKN